MDTLSELTFRGNKRVRVLGTHDKPLFVAGDICECLSISNPSDALRRIDDEDRGVVLTETPS